MTYIMLLDELLSFPQESLSAFCAAYIHDLSREHDGYCTQHGAWSAEKKLPVYTPFFQSLGLNEGHLEVIRVAVTKHSEPDELDPDHPAYLVTAMLKDADALDRIRLGANRLDVSYLRFRESHLLLPLARKLVNKSTQINMSFQDFYELNHSLIGF